MRKWFTPPPSTFQMTFKRDCQLGIDDFLLWPQPFIDEHCHLAAIPRRPETLDSTYILYSSPIDDEHFVPHYGRTLTGLGNLSKDTLQQLKLVAANLQSKAEKYWGDSSIPKKVPIFANILGIMELFESVPMTCHQVRFAFAELQRFMLEFIGAYHYLHIYQPCMVGLAELALKPSRTVGAFITSITDCNTLFHAGIPVWLVRPAKMAGSVHVDSLMQLVDSKDHLCLDDAFHTYCVFFEGAPSNPHRYKVFSQYSWHFFSFGDPFNTGHTSESSASTSSASTSSTHQPLPLSNIERSKPASNIRRSEPVVQPKDNEDWHLVSQGLQLFYSLSNIGVLQAPAWPILWSQQVCWTQQPFDAPSDAIMVLHIVSCHCWSWTGCVWDYNRRRWLRISWSRTLHQRHQCEKTNNVFRELDQVSRCPHLSPSLLFVHKYIQQ